MKRLIDLLNQSVNDEAVCRTAPATPGLLNISSVEKIVVANQEASKGSYICKTGLVILHSFFAALKG